MVSRDSGGCVMARTSLWERLQARSEFPLGVLLAITERCPLTCSHCYVVDRSSAPELSTAEIVSLMEELAGLAVLRLTLTGGEPGLRGDLIEIVSAAQRLHFAVALKTSAVLFDDKEIDALRSAGVVELHVSIYHSSADAHDSFVGLRGAWERAVAALDRFHSLGGVARANCPVMGWNVDAVPALVDVCRGHGWDYAVDPRIVGRHDGDAAPRGLRPSEHDLITLLRDKRITAPPDAPRLRDSPVCSAGRGGAYITSRGEVMPCPNLPIVFGSVRERSFEQIWRESPDRQRVLKLRWADSPKCTECSDASHCVRCPGDAFTERGTIEGPSSFDCRLARAVGRVRG